MKIRLKRELLLEYYIKSKYLLHLSLDSRMLANEIKHSLIWIQIHAMWSVGRIPVDIFVYAILNLLLNSFSDAIINEWLYRECLQFVI